MVIVGVVRARQRSLGGRVPDYIHKKETQSFVSLFTDTELIANSVTVTHYSYLNYAGEDTGARLSISSAVNRRDLTINRTPLGISTEKLAPLPCTTSMVSWVCFQ